MQEEIYPLKTILATFTKIRDNVVKKRILFDQSPIKGIGVKWIIAFFISLPLFLYAGIFNPAVFGMLGIAQAIIFYVVFLSMVMIMIIALTFINNNKVTRQITPSWNHYFPNVDLKLVLSSGATPYKDFFKYYKIAEEENIANDALHTYFANAFLKMEEENQDFFEAVNRDKRG
ncbi:MAG: hypothetical protein L3J43_01545 [Sulfurovum sp.]|nr:hypothetical protein [Sulfurovum sp.]